MIKIVNLNGITLGKFGIIWAGSVVTKDIPDNEGRHSSIIYKKNDDSMIIIIKIL